VVPVDAFDVTVVMALSDVTAISFAELSSVELLEAAS